VLVGRDKKVFVCRENTIECLQAGIGYKQKQRYKFLIIRRHY